MKINEIFSIENIVPFLILSFPIIWYFQCMNLFGYPNESCDDLIKRRYGKDADVSSNKHKVSQIKSAQ